MRQLAERRESAVSGRPLTENCRERQPMQRFGVVIRVPRFLARSLEGIL